ncbi:MAG: hypothetical protein OEZ39_18895 [Gammaproteobacteria bacterium]|nr:hypothetical protein [Gammaproteobacteria bacterium]MDH5653933.1 hypothetical protein [Gammaproteobacteria bacterium]
MSHNQTTQPLSTLNRCLIGLLFLFGCSNLQADDFNYGDVFGVSVGVGISQTETRDGKLAWANMYMFLFNLTAEYQDYQDYDITNIYTGFGLGKFLQLQYGDGSKGEAYRARMEFNIYKNLSIMLARERYPNDHSHDNTSIGLGLTFE